MDAEASLAQGKRVCWEGVGSLGQGKLKGTAVWMDPEQEKKAGDRTSSGRFLNSANPPVPPSLFFLLFLESLPGYFQLLELMSYEWWLFPKCYAFFLN